MNRLGIEDRVCILNAQVRYSTCSRPKQATRSDTVAINHELLSQIEASADEWGPSGKLGNDAEHARGGKEDDKLDERLGLHPISIRFPKALVSDLKAIAHLQGMSYQPLIREVCKRFVEAENKRS